LAGKAIIASKKYRANSKAIAWFVFEAAQKEPLFFLI
jgi:hypothetical protein